MAEAALTEAWLERLESEGIRAMAIAAKTPGGVARLHEALEALANERRSRRAIVLGIPNAGKSTVINAIVGKKVARAEDRAGVTRAAQWFRVTPNLELMDTAGILVPKIDTPEAQWKLALVGAVPRARYDPEDLVTRFTRWAASERPAANVPDLATFAQSRGFVRRGNLVDTHNAATAFLKDFGEGRFGRDNARGAGMNEQQHKRRLARERERRRLVRLHAYERAARERGFELIGGIDEVGRGPLAGPVVAACVVANGPLMLRGLNDSKRVQPEKRRELAETIKARAFAWAIGEASVDEIERLNIYHASILAMERALAALAAIPQYLLTDAIRIRSFAGEQLPVIKGDAKCATVAAASIVAKVHRDGLLARPRRALPAVRFCRAQGLRNRTAHRRAARVRSLRTPSPALPQRTRELELVRRLRLVNARSQLGKAGEDSAAAHLQSLGYRIVKRNLRGPGGEIDIVAWDGEILAFVEVKARDSRRFGSALAAVDARKRKRLRALAADFLQVFAPHAKARFDVLTVERGSLALHRNAFT